MSVLAHPHALANIGPQGARDFSKARSLLGALTVDLVRAELPKCDASGGCDPYLVLSMNNQTFKTEKQLKTRTPKWDLSFRFDVKSRHDCLSIQCFDWDRFSKNDLIGTADMHFEKFSTISDKAEIDHDRIDPGTTAELWLNLFKRGKPRGRILLKLKFDQRSLEGDDLVSKEFDINIDTVDDFARRESRTSSLPSHSIFVETPPTPRNSLIRDEPENAIDHRTLKSPAVFDTSKVVEFQMPQDDVPIGRASRAQSLSGAFAKLDDLDRDEIFPPTLNKMKTAPVFSMPTEPSITRGNRSVVYRENEEIGGTSDVSLEIVGKAMKLLEREGVTPKSPIVPGTSVLLECEGMTPRSPVTGDTDAVRHELLDSLNMKLSDVRDGDRASALTLLPPGAGGDSETTILNELRKTSPREMEGAPTLLEMMTKDNVLAALRSMRETMISRALPLLREPLTVSTAGVILISVLVLWRLGGRSHSPASNQR